MTPNIHVCMCGRDREKERVETESETMKNMRRGFLFSLDSVIIPTVYNVLLWVFYRYILFP